jgi:hypothetical protein
MPRAANTTAERTPIQNCRKRQIHRRFLKFACTVRDDRDFLIIRDALLREKMIRLGRSRRDLPIDVSIFFVTTFLSDSTAGDDLHMSPRRWWAL